MSQPLDSVSVSLLPPNASPLEKNLAGLMPFQLLDSQIGKFVTSHLVNPPDSWLVWLLYERGLLDFLPLYGGNKRTTLEDGPLLLKRRGTVWAIEEAWKLCGFPDAEFRLAAQPGLHFSEYSIDSGRIPSSFKEICKAVHFSRKVHLMRSRIRRIVSGWDDKPIVVGLTELGDSSLLGAYSGVSYRMGQICGNDTDNEELVLSFGSSMGYLIESPPSIKISAWLKPVISFKLGALSQNYPVLGEDFDGGFSPRALHCSVGMNLQLVANTTNHPRWENATYQDQSWGDFGGRNFRFGIIATEEDEDDLSTDSEGDYLTDSDGNYISYGD